MFAIFDPCPRSEMLGQLCHLGKMIFCLGFIINSLLSLDLQPQSGGPSTITSSLKNGKGRQKSQRKRYDNQSRGQRMREIGRCYSVGFEDGVDRGTGNGGNFQNMESSPLDPPEGIQPY